MGGEESMCRLKHQVLDFDRRATLSPVLWWTAGGRHPISVARAISKTPTSLF
jgi:hypothetical protein